MTKDLLPGKSQASINRKLHNENRKLEEENTLLKAKIEKISEWFSGAFDNHGKIRYDWERINDSIQWIRVPFAWFENAPIPRKLKAEQK